MYLKSSYSSTPYGQMRDRIKNNESRRDTRYLTVDEQRFIPYKTILKGDNYA